MKDKLLLGFLFLICVGISACGSTGNDADSEEQEAIKIGETLTDDLDESLSDGEEESEEQIAESDEQAPADMESPGLITDESGSSATQEDFFADAGEGASPAENSSDSSGNSNSGDSGYNYGYSDTGSDSEKASNSFSDNSYESTSPDFKGSGQWGEHNVVKGETLMKIAFNIYGDIDMWRYVYNENKEKFNNGRPLMAGMRLRYEKPVSPFVRDTSGEGYLIKEGDSLGGIALDLYGKVSKWRKIFNRNRDLIKDPNKIYAGFWLYYNRTADEISDAQRFRDAVNGKRASAPAPAPSNPAPQSPPPQAEVAPEPAPVEQMVENNDVAPIIEQDNEQQAQNNANDPGILLPPEEQGNEVEQGENDTESAGNAGEDFEDYRFPSGSF